MSPGTQQPVIEGEPDSEASASGDVRLDRLMLTVARPALVRHGSLTLRTDHRVALELVAEAVRTSLANVLDRRVRFAWRGVDASAAEPAFVVLLEAGDAECAITFDEHLARLLIDALTSDLVRLRGVGPPTESELGVLEYIVLATLADLARSWPGDTPEPTLKAFPVASEFDAWRTTTGAAAINASVAAAGAKGRMQVWLRESLAAPLAAAAVIDGGHALTRAVPYTRVRVRVALPPVTLSADEAKSLAAGDVVLLGLTAIGEGAAAMRLMTDTGWELAPLLAMEDHPTAVRFRAAPVEPSVPDEPAASDELKLVAVLAEVPLTLSQLFHLSPGHWIDVPKPAGGRIALYAGSIALGVGELVRVGKELGVRILEGESDGG